MYRMCLMTHSHLRTEIIKDKLDPALPHVYKLVSYIVKLWESIEPIEKVIGPGSESYIAWWRELSKRSITLEGESRLAEQNDKVPESPTRLRELFDDDYRAGNTWQHQIHLHQARPPITNRITRSSSHDRSSGVCSPRGRELKRQQSFTEAIAGACIRFKRSFSRNRQERRDEKEMETLDQRREE